MAVDSTGKVKGKSGGLLDDAVQITRSRGSAHDISALKDQGKKGIDFDPSSVLDQVDLTLAKSINQVLDPAILSEERKSKVAKLKSLIESGQYNPSSEDVARSVAEEIGQVVYFNSDSEGV